MSQMKIKNQVERFLNSCKTCGPEEKRKRLVILFLAGLLLLVVALPTGNRQTVTQNQAQNTTKSAEQEDENVQTTWSKDEYEDAMEKKLTYALKKMEGVGKVTVVVTVAATSNKVVEKDRETDKQSNQGMDEENGADDIQSSETTVYEETETGQTPYVSREESPEIEGVLVIAEGGDNPVIVRNISEAIQALFGIEAHKIKVTKGCE